MVVEDCVGGTLHSPVRPNNNLDVFILTEEVPNTKTEALYVAVERVSRSDEAKIDASRQKRAKEGVHRAFISAMINLGRNPLPVVTNSRPFS